MDAYADPRPAHARLRDLLTGQRVLHAPGCTDPVTARLVEQAGFEVAYLSGAVTSAVALGVPDMGFLTGADVVAHAGPITRAVDVPVIADADTGYGNALHAAATVRRYGDTGIAGLHIEDQVSPKRCGHMAGKDVVDTAEAVERVRAAVDASAGTIVVIARTDALSVHGLDAAVDRAGRFAEAGADLVFVESASTPDQLAAVHAAVPQVGKVLNRSEAGGAPPHIDDETLVAAGVALVIHPVSVLLAMLSAARRTVAEIAATGRASGERADWTDLTDLLGLPELLADEQRYS